MWDVPPLLSPSVEECLSLIHREGDVEDCAWTYLQMQGERKRYL